MFTGFAVSFVATALLMRPAKLLLRHLDVMDAPNERSLHGTSILRGAGLAIAPAVVLGLIAGQVAGTSLGLTLLGVPLAYAAIGWSDDRRSRSAVLRLTWQLVLAGLSAFLLLDGFTLSPAIWTLAFVGCLIWFAGFVNAFNFMDGINGISAATAVVFGATHMIIGAQIDNDLITVGGIVLAAAALGFLPFNFPKASIFLGDVGSYFLGSYIAVLSVIALRADVSVVAIVAPLALYLADTSIAIVRRALKGESVFSAHRTHVYQQLASEHFDHTTTTGIVFAFEIIAAVLGLLSLGLDTRAIALSGVAVALVTLFYMGLPRLLSASGLRSKQTAP